MPLSHLTLTVTNLPNSTSFFLSCLQPLGYQFIGRQDDYIGFGLERGQPADFWVTEQKPGTPAGAIHLAFPAPSREAVGDFFICALKAGGRIHGEPKMRDPVSGYYSAAVIDADGNSIEAVYRPETYVARAKSDAGGSVMGLLENGSVAPNAPSKVSSAKSESVGPPRSIVREQDMTPPSTATRSTTQGSGNTGSGNTYIIHTQEQPQRTDDGGKSVVGTLLGAAAGAAIAYTLIRPSHSPSSQQRSIARDVIEMASPSPTQEKSPPPELAAVPAPEISPPMLAAGPAQMQEPTYRAIEAAPARSYFSYQPDGARPMSTRSVSSKNPHASTIYEGSECRPPPAAASEAGPVHHDGQGRRQSSGSVYTTRDLPLRAIEYPPVLERSKTYPRNPSTLISSFVDDEPKYPDGVASVHSASTMRAPKSNNNYYYCHQQQPDYVSHHSSRRTSTHHSHSSRSHHQHHRHGGKSPAGSSGPSSTHTARHIALPERSVASMSSYRSGNDSHHSHNNKNHSAGTFFPDSTNEIENFVSSADSASQCGDGRRPSYSHSHVSGAKSRRSSLYHHGCSGSYAGSKHSERFDEPVRPGDSVSQVPSNASQRTLKAQPAPSPPLSQASGNGGGLRAGASAKSGSRVDYGSSRKGSQTCA